MSNDIIIRRRFDSESELDKHEIVPSLKGHQYEDILIECDMAHISNLPQYAKQIYIVSKTGVAVKAPTVSKEHNTNWLQAWELDVPAYLMVELALNNHVDRQIICAAVCSAVRAMMTGEGVDSVPLLREALEFTERYAETGSVCRVESASLRDKICKWRIPQFIYFIS